MHKKRYLSVVLCLIWIRPLMVIGNIGLYLFENTGQRFVSSKQWISIHHNAITLPPSMLRFATNRPAPPSSISFQHITSPLLSQSVALRSVAKIKNNAHLIPLLPYRG